MRETATNCFQVVDEFRRAEDNINTAAEERLIRLAAENQREVD